jgi:hypothetical protein
LPKKGDAKMKDLQERRTPDRYSTGNRISGPAVMDWNFKSGADYIRTERKRSSQSSVLEIYHKKPPPCDLSDDTKKQALLRISSDIPRGRQQQDV